MTIGEAAMALGVSEKTVRRRIKDGSLAAQLTGEPPRYEIPADAVSSMNAQRQPEPADELALADDFQSALWDLIEALREQLKEKDRQLEEKDRQIRELHVMLQTGQENLGRLMLNPPAYQKRQATPQMSQGQQPQLQGPRRSWWKLWS